MLTVALAAGCERESKGPRVYNHPPATVGPPADLSQFDAPAPPAPGKAQSVPVAQVAAPAPAPAPGPGSRLAGVAPGAGRRGGHGQARSRRRGAVGLRRAKPSHPPHRAGDDNFPQRLGRPGKRGGADDSTGRRRGGKAGWSADGAGPGDGTTDGEHAAASAAATGERSAGGQQPLLRRTRPVRRLVLRRLTRLGVAADRGRGRCRLAAVQPGRAVDLQ